MRPGTRAAYEALAPFYDDFIAAAGHDYAAWAAMITELGGRHGLAGERVSGPALA